MLYNDLVEKLRENKSLLITRTAWNSKQLDFWGKLSIATLPIYFNGRSAMYNQFIGYSKLKDGTEVPDSFSLDAEDLNADDWVII